MSSLKSLGWAGGSLGAGSGQEEIWMWSREEQREDKLKPSKGLRVTVVTCKDLQSNGLLLVFLDLTPVLLSAALTQSEIGRE